MNEKQRMTDNNKLILKDRGLKSFYTIQFCEDCDRNQEFQLSLETPEECEYWECSGGCRNTIFADEMKELLIRKNPKDSYIPNVDNRKEVN